MITFGVRFDWSNASKHFDGSSMKSAAALLFVDGVISQRSIIRNWQSKPTDRGGLRSATDGRRFLRPGMSRQEKCLHGRCFVSERDEGIRHGLWGTARHPAFRLGLGFYSSGYTDSVDGLLNRSNSVRLWYSRLKNATAKKHAQSANSNLLFSHVQLLRYYRTHKISNFLNFPVNRNCTVTRNA